MFKSNLLAGIYIHIPFCRKACHYCDFHFSTTLNLVDNVVDAIILEAKRMANYLKEPIETIYFGGGTPSLLSIAHLEKITKALYKHYDILPNIEFTLEANPDDLNKDKVKQLVNLGVNRLSIGTQSFHNDVLSFLNRSHTIEQTLEAVALCKQHGLSNLSLDLIYGIPNQTKAQWQSNLEALVALHPTHVSCYALTIEEKTVFGKWQKKGKLIAVEDDLIAEEYNLVVNHLVANGYEHYEVSNFAKPGFISQHNSSYWQQKKYIGLGPGAHSYNGHSRQFNVLSNPKYCKLISNNQDVFTIETLSEKEQITEIIFTTVRTKWGVNFKALGNLFGYQLTPKQLSYITSLVSENLAIFRNQKLTLTSEGYFISDAVALELIPE